MLYLYNRAKKRAHLRLRVHAGGTGEGVGGLDDLDDDVGGAGQLGWPRVERDLDGVEDVEPVQPAGGDAGSAEQVLHGGGGAEQVEDLRLDELVPRLGVALDNHVVDADAHGVGRQPPEHGLHPLPLRRRGRGPVQLLVLILILLVLLSILFILFLCEPGFGFGCGLVGLGVLRLRVLVGGGFGGGCHGWGLGGAGGERRFFVFSKTCAPVAVANMPNALPLKDGLFGLWRAGFALDERIA